MKLVPGKTSTMQHTVHGQVHIGSQKACRGRSFRTQTQPQQRGCTPVCPFPAALTAAPVVLAFTAAVLSIPPAPVPFSAIAVPVPAVTVPTTRLTAATALGLLRGGSVEPLAPAVALPTLDGLPRILVDAAYRNVLIRSNPSSRTPQEHN